MCLFFLFLPLILVHNIILTIFLFDFVYSQGMSGVSLILTSWLVGGDERQASKCKGIFIFHQPALMFLAIVPAIELAIKPAMEPAIEPAMEPASQLAMEPAI